MRALSAAPSLLLAAVLVAARAVGAAEGRLERAWDPDARAALGRVYDGEFRRAEAELAGLARAHPDDPVMPYLQALALEWRLEQDRTDSTHDATVRALAERALGIAGDGLARDPLDPRALLARGAAHGVKSRLHLFRWDRGPASREAVRMREALAAARASGLETLDLDFGLGLYDYYADTLPRFFKIVAFVLRIPGGDRERGLAAIARVARGGSLYHDDEARVQMYDVHSFFEGQPDRAVHWIRQMWRLHPGWPIWGLKLAQLLGPSMGLWDESAGVARRILQVAEEGRHPNYQPIVAEMARVVLAEALLGDLRVSEACATAGAGRGPTPGAAWVDERREGVLARCRQLEAAAETAESRAQRLLAESRRRREAGDAEGAEASCRRAFQVFPASDEARLCAARASLRDGRPRSARALAESVLASGAAWLAPQAQLVLGRAHEEDGDTRRALEVYRRAWEAPLGRAATRAEAAAAIQRLDPGVVLPEAPALER